MLISKRRTVRGLSIFTGVTAILVMLGNLSNILPVDILFVGITFGLISLATASWYFYLKDHHNGSAKDYRDYLLNITYVRFR